MKISSSKGNKAMSQDWKRGICGCFGDAKICLCGTFCAPCQVYQNAEDLGESGLIHCLIYCFIFPCIPTFLSRGKARERYGIEGSTFDDAMCSCCCGPCVDCQTANEIKQRGDHKI